MNIYDKSTFLFKNLIIKYFYLVLDICIKLMICVKLSQTSSFLLAFTTHFAKIIEKVKERFTQSETINDKLNQLLEF